MVSAAVWASGFFSMAKRPGLFQALSKLNLAAVYAEKGVRHDARTHLLKSVNERLVSSMKKNRSRWSFAFVFSLALHMLFGGGLYSFHGRFALKPKQRTDVMLMTPDELKKFIDETKTKGQIVDQDEKAVNDERDPNAKYLSRHNQKIVQETQAQLHGRYKNSDGNTGPRERVAKVGRPSETTGKDTEVNTKQANAEAAAKEVPTKEMLSDNDSPVHSGKTPTLRDLTPSFRPGVPRVDSQDLAQGGGDGPSANDDSLKDVKTGMQTMLSTREFVYFSYYNRIKDKLRQYWEPKIKEKVERIVRQGRTIASTGDKITKIIIVLNEQGILQKVQVLSPSGVSDLDDAAVEAFRAAAPFPNPPKGIIESDGTIKIRWDFVLEANARDLFDGLEIEPQTM